MYRLDASDALERAPVSVGIVDETQAIAEIVDGLNPGDRIVVGNVGTLGAGMKVTIAGGGEGTNQGGTENGEPGPEGPPLHLGPDDPMVAHLVSLPCSRFSQMFLSDVSIKRPVFATMMMVALVVLGIVSFKRLAIDEYPDITYPIVIAQTTYPGCVARGDGAGRLAPDRGSAEHGAGAEGDQLDVA